MIVITTGEASFIIMIGSSASRGGGPTARPRGGTVSGDIVL